MKILCLGDVVGRPGRDALAHSLKEIKQQHAIDFVVVNAENAAGGAGITTKIAQQFLNLGCDVLTLGDHVWDQKDLEPFLDESPQIVRPANFPEGAPGSGACLRESAGGIKVGVINLLGRTFMRYLVECPFKTGRALADELRRQTPVVIVDMHAETTSEKVAIGHFLDGLVSIVFGTHTHIQTADEAILDGGTAYITDLGMSGPYDSVIGQEKEPIIQRFLTSRPSRFQVAQQRTKLCGIIVDVDEETGRARSIERLQYAYQAPDGRDEIAI